MSIQIINWIVYTSLTWFDKIKNDKNTTKLDHWFKSIQVQVSSVPVQAIL